MRLFLMMFFNTNKAFEEIKDSKKIPYTDWIILFVLIVINLILMIPIIQKISYMTMIDLRLSPEQAQRSTEVLYKLRYLQVGLSSIFAFGILCIYGLLLYIILYLSKVRVKISTVLILFLGCYAIIAVGDLINTFLLYFRGIDLISSRYDIYRTGLNIFFPINQIPRVIYILLASINPFQICFVILLGFGIRKICEIQILKVVIISLIIWITMNSVSLLI